MRLKSFLMLAMFLILSSAAHAVGTLDGKIFTGEVGDKGKVSGTKDDFVFQDGKFKSTLCAQFGYSDAGYETSAQSDAVAFAAHTASDKGGKMDWNGTVKGDAIEGTCVTHENGQDSESWFKGTLKK